MKTRQGRLAALMLIVVSACGSSGSNESGETTAVPVPVSTSSTTAAPVATTTAPPVTTTTEASLEVSSDLVWSLFSDFFTAVAARDWEVARGLAVGPAFDYVDFSEVLDVVGGLEPWELAESPDPTDLELVDLGDGRLAVDGVLTITAPSGDFTADSPVVMLEDNQLRLENWGVDLQGDGGPPSLAARIQRFPIADGCLTDVETAYLSNRIVDGAANLLVAYQVCLIDGTAVTVDVSASYLELPDGTAIPAFAVLQQPENGIAEDQLVWVIVGYTVPIDRYAEGGISRMWVSFADGDVTQLTGRIAPFLNP